MHFDVVLGGRGSAQVQFAHGAVHLSLVDQIHVRVHL